MRLPPITKYFYILFLVCGTWLSKAQTGAIVDQIAGVVGDNIILQSEIEVEFEQLKKEQAGVRDSFKCEVMRSKLIEKLMLCKAQIDSVEINEDRVDYELEKRIRFFAMQFSNGAGIEQGQKNMEEFYGKPISQIKSDNREKIKQSMLVQEIQGKILKDVKVSPTDIKKYFAELEKTDSLPYYSAEVEVAQIIIEPKVTAEAKAIAYQKILELRNRIISGENFRTLALIYTDDKASASKGGELGFFSRGDMVPEFEATAFKLKPDSVSKIIETKYGYHILQLIDRKGDNINVRHILVRPQLFRSDLSRAK
jgi:peptidyl-prolyl cis-trans isomerase SurA